MPPVRAAFIFSAALAVAKAASPPPVIPVLDVNRYTGTWYEVARFPNRFEKACARDVTAQYSLREDGKIEVTNSCKKADGKQKIAKGTASRAEKDGPAAKLKVTFFWPFYGDYWVLDIEPNYRWALVGSPKRDYLWVLSRSPQMDIATYEHVVAKAQSLGFESARLVRTPQGAGSERH